MEQNEYSAPPFPGILISLSCAIFWLSAGQGDVNWKYSMNFIECHYC